VTSESEKAGFALLLSAEAVAAGLVETELGKLSLCILFSSLVTRHYYQEKVQMKRKQIGVVCLALALMQLQAGALAQEVKSISEKSYLQARQVLEAGIKAMGGLEALRAVTDITREMSGVRTDEGQGLMPVAHRSDYFRTLDAPVVNHPKVTSIRDFRKQRAADLLEDVILGGQPIKRRTVVTATAAFTVWYDYVYQAVQPVSPAGLAPTRAALFRRYPETLLQLAWARPETLRWIGESEYEGRKQRVILFVDADGTTLTLFFDQQTGLLTKTESLSDNAVLGDITNEVVYSDYRQAGKLMLPFRYIDKTGGLLLQDLRATSITLDTSPADNLFAAPEGWAKHEPSPPLTVTKLGEDVYAALGSYNSIFVVFSDYVLVLEAGASNGYSQSVIARIKETAPGKPIRYLVSTHFHFDHLSGVRSYIAEGATLVTTPSARTVIEKMIVPATHIMRPDGLSRNPRAPLFEIVNAKRVFEDAAHRVELYDISPNPHCAEMLIAYLPKEKILFEADMFDIELPGRTGTGGDDTVDLADKIKRLGLEVERIIPVHGRPGTMDDLRTSLSRRATNK
jgi:glyoxylase-like metal-dependent hydrolase (beta-lactamase superfamily II)